MRAFAIGRESQFPRLTIVVIAFVFLLLASAIAYSQIPWIDEALFADAGFNLATHGSTGSPIIRGEPEMTRIDQHTYWIMPLYIFLEAGWYKIVGFSLFSQRALSIAFGFAGLAAWFVFCSSFLPRGVALLACALAAFDYHYLTISAFGRNDAMCAGFGILGLAAYAALRNWKLTRAILIASAFLAAAALVHPNAILWIAGVFYWVISLDRKRLGFAQLLVAAVPFLVAAGLWSIYIAADPGAFRDQFLFNARQGRVPASLAPWRAFPAEFRDFYWRYYGLGVHSPGHGSLASVKSLVLAAYIGALLFTLAGGILNKNPAIKKVLTLLAIFVVIQTYFNQKLSVYLIHVVPLWDTVLACAAAALWTKRMIPRWVIAASLAGIAGIEAGGVLYNVRSDGYHKDFLPLTLFLQSNAAPDALIDGSGILIYRLPQRQIEYDRTIGVPAGRRPDFVVLDEAISENIEGMRNTGVAIYPAVMKRLENDYVPVYQNRSYKVLKAQFPVQ